MANQKEIRLIAYRSGPGDVVVCKKNFHFFSGWNGSIQNRDVNCRRGKNSGVRSLSRVLRMKT